MDEETIDLPEAEAAVRELVSACEVAGRRTLFRRGGRPVAVLVSWDEYLSLRETIEIAADPAEIAAIGRAEGEVRVGALITLEELETNRLRLAESALDSWNAFHATDRTAAQQVLGLIDDDPISGVPLAEPAQGYWSLRHGAFRVIYRLVPDAGTVVVLRVTKVSEVSS